MNSKRIAKTCILLGSIFFVTGCASPQYTGHFNYERHKMEFVPCGPYKRYWVTGGSAYRAVKRYLKSEKMDVKAVKRRGMKFFVRWEAKLSPRGTYGHGSNWERKMQVKKVLEIRPESKGDCVAR